ATLVSWPVCRSTLMAGSYGTRSLRDLLDLDGGADGGAQDDEVHAGEDLDVQAQHLDAERGLRLRTLVADGVAGDALRVLVVRGQQVVQERLVRLRVRATTRRLGQLLDVGCADVASAVD